ncbi:hypothetical protein [Deinococcus navajonensis]|uniref:PrsW family intramembrane metalloprotease n=1 Tax=Deinococcus navajonensis TaxID=309884 RepID=A0ABV8XQH7_9DEIO
MGPEFWLRFLATAVPIVAFTFWLETRAFRKWERALLAAVFATGMFAVFDALRGTLP